MSNETGFTLPAEEVRRVFTKWALYAVAGLLLPYFLGIVKGTGALLMASSIVTAIGVFGFVYVRRYRYVYLSPNGIRGTTTFGSKMVTLGWDEEVSLRPSSLNGLSGISVVRKGELRSLFVPVAIAKCQSFREMLKTYAPNHALNNATNAS